MGAVRLRVADLDAVRGFYERAIGLETLESAPEHRTLGAGERPLVELVVGARARRRGRRGTTGLFHLAILVPDRPRLGAALRRIAEAEWALTGASDHLVSEALYHERPRGQRDRDLPRPPARGVAPRRTASCRWTRCRSTLRLDRRRGAATPDRMAPGTVIGHVHLNVADIPASEGFYSGLLGFAPTVRGYPGRCSSRPAATTTTWASTPGRARARRRRPTAEARAEMVRGRGSGLRRGRRSPPAGWGRPGSPSPRRTEAGVRGSQPKRRVASRGLARQPLEQQHERLERAAGLLLQADLAGAVASTGRRRARAPRARPPRRAGPTPAARGGAGRDRPPSRSSRRRSGTTTSSASSRGDRLELRRHGPGGRPSTSGARRPTADRSPISSAGSSRSCAHAIESSTSNALEALALARRALRATSSIRPCAQELASMTTGSSPPSLQRQSDVGDAARHQLVARAGSPSSSTASRSSVPPRRPGSTAGGPRGGDLHQRLGQRRARPAPRGLPKMRLMQAGR